MGSYETYEKFSDAIPFGVAGVISARDDFVIDIDKSDLTARIASLRDKNLSDLDVRKLYFSDKGASQYDDGDSRGWKLPIARKRVMADDHWQSAIGSFDTGIFDYRYIHYTSWMVDWPRPDLGHHMLEENIGFALPKQNKGDWGVMVTDAIIGHKAVAGYDVNYLFPSG